MGCHDFESLKVHVGHRIECVAYGDYHNVAIECLDCNEIILDYDNVKKLSGSK